MTAHPIDGKPKSWEEVRDLHPWEILLAGNGLSMNIWGRFGYASLFEEAQSIPAKSGGLSDLDLLLFDAAGTENFELVLGDLVKTIRYAEALGEDSEPYRARYQSVRGALGNAVRAVHIDRVEAPERALSVIRGEMRRFSRVFTTSYDLITYWSMGFGETFEGFCDCFMHGSFDPASADGLPRRTTVYFVHGALHLIVTGAGEPKKLHRTDKTLLDQFGEPLADDPAARPLLISEGAHQDKQQAIDGNPYLAHALRRLRESEEPLVIFGHGLEDQDKHLIEAINGDPDRPVAVSCRPASSRPGGRNKVRKYQSHVRGELLTEDLYFFNSETHPLGSSRLTKTRRAPWRLPSRTPSGVGSGP